MPDDKPDDMTTPAFSPRQLAQLDEVLDQRGFSPRQLSELDEVLDKRGFSPRQLSELDEVLDKRGFSPRQLQHLDERLKPYLTRDEFTHTMNAMFEHYLGLVRAMFEPVYAKLEELTTVKPHVDTLVAVELPSRVDRLVFPPARRVATKRSRGRRG